MAAQSPLPDLRSFLHNHLTNIAAIDMFVVATATFGLLYPLIVLGHDRRKILHFEVTQNPTQVWLSRQITEAFPWDTAPRYLLRDRDASYGPEFVGPICHPPRPDHDAGRGLSMAANGSAAML